MKKKGILIFILTICLSGAVGGYWYIQYQQFTPEEREHRQKIKKINAFFKSAKRHNQKEEFKSAIEDYKNILAVQPDDLDAKMALAGTLAWDKQYNEAQRLTEEILKDKPDYSDALIILGNIHAWQKNYEKSIEVLTSALERNPNHTPLLMALSNVYRWRGEKGDKEKSKEILHQIVNIDPNHKEAHELLKKD